MASVEYAYLDENDNEESDQPSASAVDDAPDGGAVAWVQVAGSFCITLSTWYVGLRYETLQYR